MSGAGSAPKRRSGEKRPLRVRLLGGLILWVTTLYVGSAARTGKGRGREGAGLYPELGVLGIQEGKSPALVYAVGRCTALPKTSPVWTEIDYLERHGSAGHLDYALAAA